jgi:hypothetical protein
MDAMARTDRTESDSDVLKAGESQEIDDKKESKEERSCRFAR